MSAPYTTPSTPSRHPTNYSNENPNYTAPVRPSIHGILLPPQELPNVINEFSLRKPDSVKILTSPKVYAHSTGRFQSGDYRSASNRSFNGSSRPNTPTRRLSSHLSIRRRRRSSTGVSYDSAYAGKLTKDFLRDISRALIHEKQQPAEEPSEKIFKALDQQFRLNSMSPDTANNDYDYSLPLPSENNMLSSDETKSPPREQAKSQSSQKPAFKSYLEKIIALKGQKAKHSKPLDSIFDFDSPNGDPKHDPIKDHVNTSRFVIENTLSGLSDSWKKTEYSDSTMRLAEPVAFGSMKDVDSSNDSSDKETLLPPHAVLQTHIRNSQNGLGNFTSENYQNINFEKINQLDVPSYEPIPFYDHDYMEVLGTPGMDSLEATPDTHGTLQSDPIETEMIQGHFTIEDQNLEELDPFIPYENAASPFESHLNAPNDSQETHTTYNIARTPLLQPTLTKSEPSMKRKRSAAFLPTNLTKKFASIAQNISQEVSNDSRFLKKKKTNINSSLLHLIAEKSEEFLENVMVDLTAYAEHRNSAEINISDAVLFFNRIQSFDRSNGPMNFAATSRSIFPLECLQSLDNSLQVSSVKSARALEEAKLHDEGPVWTEDNDSEDSFLVSGTL